MSPSGWQYCSQHQSKKLFIVFALHYTYISQVWSEIFWINSAYPSLSLKITTVWHKNLWIPKENFACEYLVKRKVLIRFLTYCDFLILYLVLLKPSVTKSCLSQNSSDTSRNELYCLKTWYTLRTTKRKQVCIARHRQWNPSGSQMGGSFLSFHC